MVSAQVKMSDSETILHKTMNSAIFPQDETPKSNYNEHVATGTVFRLTVTLSMQDAIPILLEGQSSHMVQVFDGGELGIDRLERVYSKKASIIDFVNFLEERCFRAVLDYPIAYYFECELKFSNYML